MGGCTSHAKRLENTDKQIRSLTAFRKKMKRYPPHKLAAGTHVYRTEKQLKFLYKKRRKLLRLSPGYTSDLPAGYRHT